MRNALAAIAVAALLGGIPIVAAPAASATTAATIPTYSLLEKAYVSAARKYAPTYKKVPARVLVPTGWMICGQLSGGASVGQVMKPGSSTRFTEAQRFVLIATAAAFLCPAFQPAVKSYAITHSF